MRTSEALFAKWPVFALAEKVWIVPAEHMKMKYEHRVLSFYFLDFGGTKLRINVATAGLMQKKQMNLARF